MKLGITQKNMTVSLLAIAAGASMASANSDMSVFALDLLDNGSTVETLHAAPQYSTSTPDAASTSQSMVFQIISSTDQPSNFEALLSNNAGSLGQSQGIFHANAIQKSENFFIVPLPSAAIAGMGLMCGLVGVRFARSRR